MQLNWKTVQSVLLLTVATFISSVGVNSFLVPHALLGGGVTGIAVLFYYLTGLPTWLVVFVLNVPLFILAFFTVSRRFIFLSLIGMLEFTFFLWLTSGLNAGVDNVLVSAITGGLLSGIGGGLALRQGASMGGLDIVGVMANKFFNFPVGGFGAFMNVIILTILAFIYGLEQALTTLVALYIASVAIDAVQAGFNRTKTVFIISSRWVELTNVLFEEINRGVTILHGEGGYTHANRTILYCMVRSMELAKLKSIVFQVDPKAYVSIIDTREIQGGSFKPKNLF
ncbi:MAG: YitT family protein [Christensenellales bacterium]|jgi:uncharacterized membrane-anchored protein YitT (DUF2179 family)